jgi:hypothetical protein
MSSSPLIVEPAWCSVLVELDGALKKSFGKEWQINDWQAGTDDRLLVVFEKS